MSKDNTELQKLRSLIFSRNRYPEHLSKRMLYCCHRNVNTLLLLEPSPSNGKKDDLEMPVETACHWE